jgi:FAD/FMN-containing dehydrogenase
VLDQFPEVVYGAHTQYERREKVMAMVSASAEERVAFARTLRGQLLQPGDAGYDETRGVWNGMIDRRPDLIARCAGAGDVIAAVNFARENGMVVSVRGGGHSISGACVCEGGMMIDLATMKGVRVDPVARTVRAEGGATWHDVDYETQAFGLAVTGGQVSHTGIAGLTLGGGFGNLMRKFGLSIDNLISADVVTADGRLLTVCADENPDLFWGIRGGGGNFGIVTSFEYRVHPVGPIIVGGMAGFDMSRAGEITEFFREYMAGATDDVGMTLAFITAPPLPFVPQHLHFQPVVALLVCHAGSLEQGMADLAPIRALQPDFDVIGPMPYVAIQSIIDDAMPYGKLRYYAKSGFLDELSGAIVDGMVAHCGAPSSPFNATVVVAAGGAVSRVGEDATAFGHRHADFDLTIFGAWTDEDQDDRHIAWARAFYEDMRPYLRGVYVNSMADELDRITEAYPEETYRRLVTIKNTYDPTNFFRLNQNIRPTV